jgi:hypothetical protein
VLLHAPRPVRTRFGRPAPTPHGLTDLTALTRSVAAQVRTGAHEVVLVPEHRWYRRLYADPFVDVWLISWATEQATELHDHAGSLGALTVVSGELEEQRWIATERGLRMRRIRAGSAPAAVRPSTSGTCTTWSTPRAGTPSACTRTPRRSRRCRTTRSTPAAAWCAPAPS